MLIYCLLGLEAALEGSEDPPFTTLFYIKVGLWYAHYSYEMKYISIYIYKADHVCT